MKICHNCQKPLQVGRSISRVATCPHCDNDLHCCLNCALYSEYAPNKCKEPQSEHVSDRERSNFCDFFTFAETNSSALDKKQNQVEEARRKLEALFNKKPEH